MGYIYDHFDSFKLIICKSRGTRYENFAENLIEIEENATVEYFKILKDRGVSINDIPRKEIHLLVTCTINAMFETVIHDFEREEAMSYCKNMDKFFKGGWKNLMGL